MTPAKRNTSSATSKKKNKSNVVVKKPTLCYKLPYEKEDDLIAIYRAKEYLYNQSLTDYYNKGKKERCYQAKQNALK